MPPQLAEDIESLRADGYEISVIEDGSRYLVILGGFLVPDGRFVPNMTDVMVIADYQYPQSKLDMCWTNPHVQLASGGYPKNADNFEVHAGRNWHRWSWHYSWDPIRHNL